MSVDRLGHWEIAAAATAGALGAWVAVPSLGWALLALLASLLALGLATRPPRRALAVLVSLTSLVGAVGAVMSAQRVRAVEARWPQVRAALVEDARRRLDATLGEAVDLARRLAAGAAGVGELPRGDAFGALEAALQPGAPEHGVVLFDRERRPVSWAGRHRVPVTLPGDELDAFITPFYAVLTAQRQQGQWTAASQVLLAADSAVPDRDNSVAARFAARTGVGLQIFAPRTAPAVWTDVFDYCLPSCRAVPAGVVPDTLFSVRAVPPAQGDRKLELLAAGRRWGTLSATLVFLLLALAGSATARYAAALGVAAVYWFTPAGEYLGLGAAFSPATYFFPSLGPFSASAGAVLLSAALVTAGTMALRLKVPRWSGGGVAVAGVLVVATPYVISQLAEAITPPSAGVSIGLWVWWQVTITAAGSALLVLAAALLRDPGRRPAPRWTAWVAPAWAVALALIGLWLWQPSAGWPAWYAFLWVPAFALAVWPVSATRLAVTNAVVVGTAAALFTWGATVRGRLALAEADLARLASPEDPVAAGLLERFGVLQSGDPPRNAAELYREWQRSPLAAQGYPAVLAAWDPGGRLVAQLALADLELPPALLQALARSAADGGAPIVERLNRAPGTYYVLAAPFPDGAVVTVGVGPRSRVFAPVRVAQFLRGESVLGAPYDITIAEPYARFASPPPSWRRVGRVVREERPLDLPGGPRHVHLRVDLGDPVGLVVRGILVTVADVLLVGLLWMTGHALTGRVRVPGPLPESVRPRSYRARLTLALGAFFIAPTVAFAAWSFARVRADVESDAGLLTRRTLRDASTAAGDLGLGTPEVLARRLSDLGTRFDADLLVYDAGVLAETSTPVLQQLGLVDPYLPPSVFRRLLIEDDVEVTDHVPIGGRQTLVGYRNIGVSRGEPVVLGAPRLIDDTGLVAERGDLALTLMLAILAGLAAAAWLAAQAARALARPVHLLREAAVSVGQGQPLPPRGPDVPPEFVPVVQGLERMAHDVRTSQAALEAARQRTAAVLRSVATGVIALDQQLKVAMANPRAEELLGVRLPEGADARRLTGEDWQSLWEWLGAFAQGGAEPEAHELVVGERRIRAQVAALGGDGGCVLALDDTTDLAHAVRVLAWGELARQIAHEIKNPLTPLRLGIQHLERAYRDRREDYAETLRRTAGQILAEIERLDSIARAFARFGAPPAEAGPLARENLGEAARETAQLYALGGEVTVVMEAAPKAHGRVRRDEFKEVLVNLIENARSAGASRIVMRIAPREGGGASVAVRDDGRGILLEHLPQIFEPQFSTTTSGTGLGLAICKRLVESWGGSIAVESEPGKGTTVTIVTQG